MSRHLGTTILLVLIILLLAVALRQDPGYVLISWGTTSVEMSLTLGALLWLGSLWLVVRLVVLERWLVRLWRADWSRFFGLGRRAGQEPARESAQKLNNPSHKA